jgi:superfamily II DNA or RNA helicase
MKIFVDSQIRIQNPSKQIIDYIKKELEIPNPEITKKQAMGFWCGNIPKTLKAYSKNGNDYIIPIGEIDNIWKLHPVKEDYTIDFGEHEKMSFPEIAFKLYDYQEKAVNEAIKFKRGILSSKCGSGKSIMALEIIARLGYKALIICEKKEILQQFIGYLKDVFNMQPGQYGTIQEGKVEIGTLVTIALRQTLAKIDLIPYKYEWGTIIVDECQNVGGSVTKCTQYSKILNNLAAKYRYGISATGYRVDGLTRFMYSLLNTIKYEIPEEAIADKVIKAKVKPIYTGRGISQKMLKFDGTLDYQKIPTILATDEVRNKIIIDLLKKEKDNYCLILSDRLEGLEYLHNQVGGLFINGKMTSKKAKQERQEAIEKMRNKEEHYLFASYSLAKERT